MRTTQLSEAVGMVERLAQAVREGRVTCGVWDLETALKGMDRALSVDESTARIAKAAAVQAVQAAIESGALAAGPMLKPLPVVTLSEAIEKRLARIEGNSSSKKYGPQIRGMIERFAEHAGVNHVSDVNTEHLDRYVTYLRTDKPQGAGLSPKTCFNVKGALKEFFAFCVSKKWILESPADHVELGKLQKAKIRFFTASEVEKVLAQAKAEGKHDLAAAFAVACYAGPRLQELHGLTRDRIHLERRKLQIVDHKRKDIREVPIFDCLLPHLQKLLIQRGNVARPFGESRSSDALGRAISRLVRRALPKREQATYAACADRGDAAQAARRTYSTHLRAGTPVSVRRVAAWSGHRPEVDSSSYCGLLPDGERAIVFKFMGRALISEGLPVPYPEPKAATK